MRMRGSGVHAPTVHAALQVRNALGHYDDRLGIESGRGPRVNEYVCECGSTLMDHTQFVMHFMLEVHWAMFYADLVMLIEEVREE